jgi:photosystem II stability/assembly factor-like uncharacterized protein
VNRKSFLSSIALALGPVLLVLASPAAAVRWIPLGPPDGATIFALAYDPAQSRIVYAGTAGGGVVKSLDGGRSWSPSSLGLGDPVITALAVDQQDPRNVYAGTPGGLFRSHDRGRTWLASPMKLPVDAIAVDPRNAGHLYIGTKGAGTGLYHSTDGGSHWVSLGQEIAPFEKHFWAPALVIAPSQPRTLYAIYVGARSGAFRSRDGGKTWTLIRRAKISALAVDPVDPEIVYAAEGRILWTSADGGRSWGRTLLRARDVNSLHVAPDRTVCATTPHGGLCSEDLGVTWTPIRGLPRNRPVWTLAFDPQDPDRVLAGTGGTGVHRSEDAGRTWQSSSAGLVNFEARALAVVTDPPALLTGGFPGAYRTTDDGATWQRVLHRDIPILSLAVAPSDPAKLYAGTGVYRRIDRIDHLIFRSTDGGRTWQRSESGLTESPIVSLAVDPRNPRTVYAGSWSFKAANQGSLFRSTDGGVTWAAIPGLGGTSSIAFDPTDPRVIYITQGRGLFHSRDGGGTWVPLMSGEVLSERLTRGFAVAPSDPHRLAVIDSQTIFLSFDAGNTWERSGSCGSTCRVVAFDPTDADTLYVGRSPGVLRTIDGGATWHSFSTGLPAVDVHALTFDPAEPTKLYAGTASAGVFLIDLAQ